MDKDELASELRDMLLQLAHINDCFLLHKKILLYTKTMNREMNISPAFFQIIMYSLEHTYMMDISKLYDKDGQVKGIRKAINLCEHYSTLFPKERTNVFLDGEIERSEVIRIDVLKDIKSARNKLTALEPILKSLRGRRNKYYAHRDKKYVNDLSGLAAANPLSWEQLSELIETAGEILNTFLQELVGEVVALNSANYDDIDNLFKILSTYLND